MENKKNTQKSNIKNDLERFKVLWDESVDDNHKNVNELGNLARKIRDAKCNDEFLISSLSEEEQTTYRYAIKLANVK